MTITRSAEEVFAYLADFRHDLEWRSEVTDVRELDGGRYLETMRFPGVHVSAEFAVVACEPPRLLAAEGASEGMRASQRYELAPLADGGTRLDVSTRIETHGLLAIGEPVAAVLLKRRARENLLRLKRLLESRG